METSFKMQVFLFFLWSTLLLTNVNAIGECDSDPCMNGATCVDDYSDSFTCLCDGFWQGVLCDVAIPSSVRDGLCPLTDESGTMIYHVYEDDIIVTFGNLPAPYRCISNIRIPGAIMVNFTFVVHHVERQKDEAWLVAASEGVVGDVPPIPFDSTNLDVDNVLSFTNAGSDYWFGFNADRTLNSNFTLQISADRDDCFSAPCMNGATCIDSLRAFQCICLPGFQGLTCDVDTDECRSDPCLNGGSCLDGDNSYTCQCTDSYTGVNCGTGIVIVDSTTPTNIGSSEVREGITAQSVSFDLTFSPATANTFSITGGSGLWQVSGFFSSGSNGIPEVGGGVLSLASAQQAVDWSPPSDTTITSIQANSVSVPSGVLCSDMQYFCARIARGTAPSPNFELRGDPSDTALVGCTTISCRGVEITGSSLTIVSGELRDGLSGQTVVVNFDLQSSASGGGVSGSDLWRFGAYGSQNSAGSLPISFSIDVTPQTSSIGVVPGVTSEFNGLSLSVDLTGANSCNDVPYICVVIAKSVATASPDFTLTTIPNADVLTACASITCRGVEISETLLDVTQVAVQEGTSQLLTLNIRLSPIDEAGSVTGSGLIDVISFLSASSDGSGDRFDVSRSTASGVTAITAGVEVEVSNLDASFDLTDGPTCSGFNYVCVEIQRGASSSIEYQLSGNPSQQALIGCQEIACRGVEISGTSLDVSQVTFREGTSQVQALDIVLLSIAEAGSVSGSGLIDVISFLTDSSDGSGNRLDISRSAISAVHNFTGIVAGVPAQISNLAVNFDLTDGPTCSGFNFVCVEIQRGTTPSTDYQLSGNPSEDVLIDCALVNCRGVEVTATNVGISGGEIIEGSLSTLTFNVALQTNANGGSVEGSGLWQAFAYGSTSPDGSGDSYLRTPVNVPSGAADEDVLAGQVASLTGLSASFMLSSSVTCAQFQYLCVEVQRGTSPTPDFGLTGVPDQNSLIGCTSTTCGGVEITDTILTIQNGNLQEGFSSSRITFDMSLISNPDGGSVSGSNLWNMTAWISADPAGAEPRYLEQSLALTPAQSGTPIVSGVDTATISNVIADWDLSNGPLCTQAGYMCVRVEKGDLADPDFQVSGQPNSDVFIDCASIQCRDVAVTGTELDLVSTSLLEGASQTVSFDYTINSDQLGGGVNGTNLWDMFIFLSDDSSGSNQISNEQSIRLTEAQANSGIVPGVPTVVMGLEAMLNLQSGPTCSQFSHVCVRLAKSAAANPNFGLTGSSDASLFIGCQAVSCTGVRISSTSLDLLSGDIQEGTLQEVRFDFNLLSDAAGGSVSGSNLWQVTVFGSQNINGLGSRVDSQVLDLTAVQGETAISAGTPAEISGITFNWDLSDGPLCSEFSFLCAQIEKHPSSSLDFALTGIPDDAVLTTCSPVTCRGVDITRTTVTVANTEVLEGTDQTLDLSIILESDIQGGSVNGDDLWRVEAFLSADENGNDPRLNQINISLTPTQSGLDITAGSPVQLLSLGYPLDLVGGTTCSSFQYVCVEVSQGPSPVPAFQLDSLREDLIDCMQVPCRGVEITNSVVNMISGGVREGITGQPLTVDFTLESNQLAGSVSGTNLWDFVVFGSANPDGSGDRVSQSVFPTSSHYNTPLVAGVNTVFEDISIIWDMNPGSTCDDVQYICFEASRNNESNPDFTLTVSSSSVLRDCQELACRGVEVTGTSLVVTSGSQLVEGDSAHEVVFNILVDSDAAAGSVSGSNLWQVTAYASGSSTPGGSVISPVPVTLTPSQSNTGIIAGSRANISQVTASLNLENTLCSAGVEGFCVEFERNQFSTPSFTFDPQPNTNILTSCVPATCTGVQVTEVNFNVNSGGVLLAGSDNHDLNFNLNILTNGDGADVAGSDLWEVEVFLNSQIDGQGITTLTAPAAIPDNSQPLTAGLSYTLDNIATTLNLYGSACDLPFVCVRLNKNPNSNPDFTLSELSSDSLVSCQSLPCMDTNECDPNPCINGVCTDGVNSYSCTCQEGYTGTNCEQDIDECTSMPCLNGGTCTQGVNSFTCTCAPGFTGTFCNEDIDECASDPCMNGGSCENLIAEYTCECLPGYTGINCEIDIDECESSPCQNSGTCNNRINEYFCDCAPGYAGTNCENDIDECSSFPCRNGGQCTDLINGFFCTCEPGWTGLLCDQDVNECLSNPCVNGQCQHGINFYFCNCEAGYTGTNCEIDIDECASDPCLNGATCIDEVNGYTCMCAAGWTDTNCQIDINECLSNPCNDNGICINLENQFQCDCSAGWTGTRCETNIDECASIPCLNGGTCTDEINMFTCTCTEGFTGVFCEIEINECSSQPCQNGGTCEDGDNTFVCQCQDGWTGETCTIDINECESSPCLNGGTCTQGIDIFICQCPPAYTGVVCEVERRECESDPCLNGATCNELTNGYDCSCQPGYTGTHCEININECNSGPCENGGNCIDEINGYTCDCADGYEGVVCQFEINECASDPCQNGGTCEDSVASYLCTCAPGWTGINCETDVNECASLPCKNGGQCTHSTNAYSCTCPAGYTGINCEIDIDECSSSPCQNGGQCEDFVNLYICTCIPGFTGTNCETDIMECDSGPCLNGGTCIDNINSYSCECASGYAGIVCSINIDECNSGPCLSGGTCIDQIDGYECDCPSGREGVHCELDVNECASMPCENGGDCTDLPDSYSCGCVPGYTGTNCEFDVDECSSFPCMNGGTCNQAIDYFSCQCLSGFEGTRCEININECASNPCRNGGICLDGVNSYTCNCANGWTGAQCEIDIDECESNPCVNGACDDGVYSFICYCDPGWTGERCSVEIDECESSPCQNGGFCLDAANSYSCVCVSGWTGYNCETDFNECGSNPCLNGAVCNDGIDQYTCTCAAGWTGTHCDIDIDECALGPCLNSGSCTNSQNSYICSCTPAWTGTNCEIEVDECQSNPCLNGGVCNDQVNFYTCTCASGYTGVHCETAIRYCFSNPCVSGLCVDEINAFRCVCDAGWTGELCSININDCFDDSCLNGGTCTDGVNSFTCNCAPGWTGTICDEDVNECSSNPCQNGAICNNLQNMYTCTCLTGYTGVNCEIDIDECSSQPCRNGGLCLPNPDGLSYRCACQPGYTGDNCETDIDECGSGPCTNGGTCEDEINAFRCICLPGYGGTTCRININDCSINPCLNGGFCLDMIDGYICACPQGYSGTNCEINEDECSSNPCLNGGACINREQVHGYDCQCAIGYTGTNCEINIDDCATSPCLNNGICIDGINSYTCTCSQGWTGVHCEISTGCRVNYTLGVGGKVIINSPSYPSNYGNAENCLWFITGLNGRDVNIDFKDFITENRYDTFTIGVGSDPNIGSQRISVSGPVEPSDTTLQGANTIWISFQSDNEKTDRGFSVEFRDSAYIVLTPCDAQPCINGGSCSNVGTINFQCECTSLWTGQNCEIPSVRNKCGLNPCANGAECVNMGEDYTCNCPDGFTGKNCTQDIDECAQNPCQNGGECYNLINAYVCVCQSCYSGINCEVAPPTSACSVNLCENDGDCSFAGGAYQCSCQDGYEGDYCQNDVDKCRFNPCSFGTCSTVDTSYQCTCNEGYMGTQCDIQDTTECINANPCQNGAACTVENGTYSCDCPAGFDGEYCSENIDDCGAQNCSGNGVCEDGINGFICACQSGYLGELCQIDIDECASSPCLNGGICVNNANGFICVCTGNFVEPLCTPEQIISVADASRSTFMGTRISLDPYFILLIVALALFAIFFLLLFLIANCCKAKTDKYDTEKARLGEYPSQTRPDLSILNRAEPPATRENDYGIQGPIPPAGGGNVSTLNSYENPWPQTEDELQKTAL